MYSRYGFSNIGKAQNASQSAYPNLWYKLVGLWVPSLGKQGKGIADLSGRLNFAASFSGGTVFSPGRTGWAWAADSDTATTIHGNDISGVVKFTLMAWALQNTLDVIAGLFSKLSVAGSNAIRIETYSDGNLYSEVDNGADTYGFFDYSTVVTAGKWFHWAVVFDGSGATNPAKMQFYINGRPITLSFSGTLPTTTGTNTASYNLAYYNAGGASANWNGLVDDYRLYTRAFSAREVRQSMFLSPLIPKRRKAAGKAAAAVVGGQPMMRRWGGVPTMLGGPLIGRSW